MSTPDRISYSLGGKVNTGNYENVDYHVGMSSDVRDGETPEKALRRIKKFIEEQADKEANEIRSQED